MTRQIDRATEMKRRSRGWSDDMSGEGVSHRLKIVAELYDLWWYLKLADRKTTTEDPTNGDQDAGDKSTAL